MPHKQNSRTIPAEEFWTMVNHGRRYEGYVEGLGLVHWEPIPSANTQADYPQQSRLYRSDSTFVTQQYALCITPIDIQIDSDTIAKEIINRKADGSIEVNTGKWHKAIKVSKQGNVNVDVDNTRQQITITAIDTVESKTTKETIVHKFNELEEQYPNIGKSLTFSTENGNTNATKNVLDKSSKVAYIAGIITSHINSHMGTVHRFRKISDGWGNTIYRASSWYKYSIIPGKAASWIAKAAKPVAYIGTFITILQDGAGINLWLNDPKHQDAIHPAKGGLDLVFSAIGYTGWGAPASIAYFGIDSFYPGGWSKALDDRAKREQEARKIIPGYQEVPYGPKW